MLYIYKEGFIYIHSSVRCLLYVGVLNTIGECLYQYQ